MSRLFVLLYGLVVYAIFLPTFLYAIGFVGGYGVPKTIDSGAEVPLAEALMVNVSLLGLFAVQHSVMARLAFKRWWTRWIPEPIERSTFVLITCGILVLLFWQWRPMTSVVWSVEQPTPSAFLQGVGLLGWGIVLFATLLIDHLDLFGVRQVVLHFRRRDYEAPPFQMKSLYRWIRHPLLAGFMIAFWATPHMTVGHLLFAVATTGYMLIAIQLEERTLLAILGEPYRNYRERVPMLLPIRGRAPKAWQPHDVVGRSA